MAEKLHSDSERLRRIEIVGDLFLKTGYSTRTLALRISHDLTNGFKISNATVCDYLKRYKLLHNDKVDQIDSLIEANKGSSIKDQKVINRVYKVAELISKNYSIEDISKMFDISYWVIYYDIDIRLKKLNTKLYQETKKYLEKRN